MMDGEAQVTAQDSTPVTATEAVADSAQENSTTEQDTNGSAKPEGFDPVDVKTATQEQVEARLNRLYGNMKRYENESKEFKQANELLIQQLQQLQQNQNQIVDHLQNTNYQDTEATIKTQMRQAWDKGDIDNWTLYNEKLSEIKVQKALSERDRKAQKPNEIKPNGHQRALSATEALELSVANGETPPQEAQIMRAYFSEIDQSGQLLRPWVNVSDIRNTQAARIASVVFDPEHPVFGSKSLKDKLAEVDRQMGIISRQPNGSGVLPAGNLTRGSKVSTVKMTPYEETVAVRTKFGGPKAKTDQDHIEAWRQAKIKSQSNSRSR